MTDEPKAYFKPYAAYETLHLLLELEDERTRSRRRESLFLSIIFHMLVVLTLLVEPMIFKRVKNALMPVEERKPKEQLTYLAEPPEALRPKIKPKTPVLSDQDRLARPGLEAPVAPKLPPLPPPPAKAPGEGQQLAQAQPPKEMQLPGPGQEQGLKLGEVQPNPKLALPDSASPGKNIEETLRGLARNKAGGGGETVWEEAPGRFDPRNPAAIGQAAILSDTQGVNFNPYLNRILLEIKRNWYAVMPEIARLGRRGKVVTQFEILKDGGVNRIYLVASSGTEPLDRAALAGISASVPFPPLPQEFRGGFIRLQIIFLYNLPLDYP